MKRFLTALIILSAALLSSCKKITPDPIVPDTPDLPSDTTETPGPDWPEGQTGTSYVWDEDHIPVFHITIAEKQWNKLLNAYDINPDVSEYVQCNVIFDKGGVRDTITNVGIRLFDNVDAMRPEGNQGEEHSDDPRWKFSNYQLNFLKYVNKEEHSLRKVGSVFLKSCVNDPSYARERYCYDLFRRFGIKTVSRNIFCRLNIHVEGDAKPAYFGIYQMIEPINQEFIDEREPIFKNRSGYLWRCRDGASLTSVPASCGTDNGNGENFTYMLMNNKSGLAEAQKQLYEFTSNVKSLHPDKFIRWFETVCDIKLLLRTYAVSVTTGMWDDYWNRGNNFYLYFNNTSPDSYKVFMIPHDFEMSLGNSNYKVMADPGKQSPYSWGKNGNPLISRILQSEEYMEMYRSFLLELILPEAYLFDYRISKEIISDLMYQASFYVKNDTGYNIGTKDITAGWSNHPEYRIREDNDQNFFKVRAETIRYYSE